MLRSVKRVFVPVVVVLNLFPIIAEGAPGDTAYSFLPATSSFPVDLAFHGDGLYVSETINQNPGSRNAMISVNATTGALRHSFEYPGQTLRQIAWDGQLIWALGPPNALDSEGRATPRVQVDPTIKSVDVPFLLRPLARGIAWDVGCNMMWDLSSQSSEVHLRDYENRRTEAVLVTELSHDGLRSLAYDGCSLWTIDSDNAQLVRLNVETGAVIERMDHPAVQTVGLTFDGVHLLASSTTTGRVYALEIAPVTLSFGLCQPRHEISYCLAKGEIPPMDHDAGVGDGDAAVSGGDAGMTAGDDSSGGCSISDDPRGLWLLAVVLWCARRRARAHVCT